MSGKQVGAALPRGLSGSCAASGRSARGTGRPRVLLAVVILSCACGGKSRENEGNTSGQGGGTGVTGVGGTQGGSGGAAVGGGASASGGAAGTGAAGVGGDGGLGGSSAVGGAGGSSGAAAASGSGGDGGVAGEGGVGGMVAAGCQPLRPPEDTDPVEIAAGYNSTCARSHAGVVKCWGGNAYGQLGQGDTDVRGDAPSNTGANLKAVDLGDHAVQALSLAGLSACALLDDQSVRCWGANGWGQLGQGDRDTRGDGPDEMGDFLPSIDLGSGEEATSVSLGGTHVCALLASGALKCWGSGIEGELGQGNRNPLGDDADELGDNLAPVQLGGEAVQVSTGDRHSCALLGAGDVKCWGYNDEGRLGLGHEDPIGFETSHLGENLASLMLGAGLTPARVVVGDDQACVLFDDGRLKCWGAGIGSAPHLGDAPEDMGDNLPFVDLGAGRHVIDVFLGPSHLCATLDDGSAKCWGNNHSGQLGTGDEDPRGDDPAQMGDNLLPLDLGTDVCALSLAAGSSHTCALLSDYTVKCWGTNANGILGWGNVAPWDFRMGDELPSVRLSF